MTAGLSNSDVIIPTYVGKHVVDILCSGLRVHNYFSHVKILELHSKYFSFNIYIV